MAFRAKRPGRSTGILTSPLSANVLFIEDDSYAAGAAAGRRRCHGSNGTASCRQPGHSREPAPGFNMLSLHAQFAVCQGSAQMGLGLEHRVKAQHRERRDRE